MASGAFVIGGTTTPWTPEPGNLQMPEDGWDVYVMYQVVYATGEDAACAQFELGSGAPVGSYLYLVDREATGLIPGVGLYKVKLTFRGLVTPKAAKIKFTSFGEKNSYQDVLLPGMTLGAGPADVSEPRVGVTVRYIAQYADGPDYSEIGTSVTPPLVPDELPAFLWDDISNPVYIYPNGWVLEKRDGDLLSNTDIYLMEDSYAYFMVYRPSK